MSNSVPPLMSRHIAVIGSGASGLVTARELRREGHRVVVFEQSDQVGGTWVYTEEVETDPLGLDPSRRVIHSSLYNSLRTNLPREVMGFRDFPFVLREGKGRDPRRFPGHQEVLFYLQEFASAFQITELVRLDAEVIFAEMAMDKKWKVRSKSKCGVEKEELYDAVVVCNGHYTIPRVADIRGMNSWPGKQMHSHNYRTPEPFQGEVVVVIGGAASAVDISREVAKVAKEVHIAARSHGEDKTRKLPSHDNIWLHSLIDSVHGDGGVLFQDGGRVHASHIIHCTGYKYHFPFLNTKDAVTVDDNRVGPLYKHVFPPALAPRLSFVGLPWKVVPFPLFEYQSKWIAGALSGRITLPSEEEMLDDVKAFYCTLQASGVPKSHTHNLELTQWDYNNWISIKCGVAGVEEWRKSMYIASSKSRVKQPETYRDEQLMVFPASNV